MTLSANFFNLQKQYRPLSESESELKYLFSDANPYLQNGVFKEFFLDNASVIGMFNSELNLDSDTAYFGFMALPNNHDAFVNLFGELEKWAKSLGCKRLIGPINFSTFNTYRLKMDSFHLPSFLKEPNNPEYYPQKLADLNFKLLNKYQSYLVTDLDRIDDWYQKYIKKTDLFKFTKDYEYIKLNATTWLENLDEIYTKAELVFGSNFAFKNIDLNTFKMMYGHIVAYALCDKTSLLIKHSKDGIIGLILNFPNLLEGDNPKTILIKTLGILPEYSQLGGQIIKSLLEITPQILERYERMIFCLMQDGNYPSLLGKEFAQEIINYGLFEKDLF